MDNKNFRIQIMNHIAERGIAALVERGCTVGKDVPDPQGILLRSADLHDYPFGDSLLVIARSGAGTNNIPLDLCCDRGIVVFNSPGANAEAVKELIICSMVMSSRDVLGSIAWVRSIADEGETIPELVEKKKASFTGPELLGKTFGVIGLGAVGALVANAGVDPLTPISPWTPPGVSAAASSTPWTSTRSSSSPTISASTSPSPKARST